MRVEKHWVWVIFFSVWDSSRENYGHAFLLLGYTIAKITVHAPGQHMWLSPGPWPYSECSKTVEVKGQKTLSARDHHWRILRKKDYRELCNVKARLLNMTDHTLFSLRLIQTDGLMIKTSFSDLGYMGLNPAGCWTFCQPSAVLCDTEPVIALTTDFLHAGLSLLKLNIKARQDIPEFF